MNLDGSCSETNVTKYLMKLNPGVKLIQNAKVKRFVVSIKMVIIYFINFREI